MKMHQKLALICTATLALTTTAAHAAKPAQLDDGLPTTTHAAYTKAQKALQSNEEMTFSEAEIDALLPNGLRRGC